MIKLTEETLKNRFQNTKYGHLNLHQRIVLNNGGCLTKLLEDLLEEELSLKKLKEFEEKIETSSLSNLPISTKIGDRVLQRAILLQGKETVMNHLYAESITNLDNLNSEFVDLLKNSNIPIGKIWEMLKVETYKTLIAWGDEKAGLNAGYFNISAEAPMLYRTYLVYSDKKPVMQITEKFPQAYNFLPANRKITA